MPGSLQYFLTWIGAAGVGMTSRNLGQVLDLLRQFGVNTLDIGHHLLVQIFDARLAWTT